MFVNDLIKQLNQQAKMVPQMEQLKLAQECYEAPLQVLREFTIPDVPKSVIDTNRLMNMIYPKWLNDQHAATECLKAFVVPNLVTEHLSQQALDIAKALSNSNPIIEQLQNSAFNIMQELNSQGSIYERLNIKQVLNSTPIVDYLNQPAFNLIQTLDSNYIQKFYGHLATDSFAQIINQAKTINLADALGKLDAAAINEFQVYSQKALSTQPEELIASETKTPSKYWTLFTGIIVALVQYVIAAYIGMLLQTHQAQLNLPFLDNQTANTPKQVIREAKNDVCAEQLSVCRFVTATKLYVRVGAGKKYDAVDSLKFGQGVIIDALEVNEKDRDWVFVHYYDKNTESYKNGWVYRRYLKRYVN